MTLGACSPSTPNVAHLLLPLTGALHGCKWVKLVWTNEMSGAFYCATMPTVWQPTFLSHLEPEAAVSLVNDASDSHVRAVLQQMKAVA